MSINSSELWSFVIYKEPIQLSNTYYTFNISKFGDKNNGICTGISVFPGLTSDSVNWRKLLLSHTTDFSSLRQILIYSF